MVQAKSYSIITDEIGKCRRPNLFSIPVENTQNWIFELHKIAICRKTNLSGTFWIFFLKFIVIYLSVFTFSERLIKK